MYNTYMIKLFIYFSCVSYLLTNTCPYNFISNTPNTHKHLVTLHNYGYLLTCNDMPDRYRLKCGVININANKTAYYDSKVQHHDFSSFSKGLDVIGIMETHAASKQDVQKQGYHHCAVVRKRLPWPDLLAGFHITETQYPPTTQNTSKKNRRWWIKFMATPTNMPKLCTFHKFHPSFHTAPYLNQGPHYLRAQVLRLCCSNHRLDIELGRHPQTPRELRTCRFCNSGTMGYEYHVFQCTKFLDLQVYYNIHVTCKPSNQTHNDISQLSCPVSNTNRAIHNTSPHKFTLQHIYPLYYC